MIQTTKQITKVIEQDSAALIGEMLKDLIQNHRETTGRRQKKLYDRYMFKDLPIHKRVPASYEKVDRRTAADFFGDIVDTKTGYMGNEVTVEIDRDQYKDEGQLREEEYRKDTRFIQDFNTVNNTLDLNSEAIKTACICGVSYRWLYLPAGENYVKIMNLNPWEVIYIYDKSLDKPQLVIRYYTVKERIFGQGTKEITFVEWFDENETVFYRDDGFYNFEIDSSQGDEGRLQNLFNRIPIIPMLNNGEELSEAEKAIDIIDAYDAIISSTTSEIEQLRLAYMYAKGAGTAINKELLKVLEQTGIFPLPSDGEIGFIKKEIAADAVTNFLSKLEELIYKFSKSVNMSRDYGGEMRVIGWQVTLLPLENSSVVTERKFKKSLREQYSILTDYWRKFQNTDIDINSLSFIFTRHFPRDINGEAKTLQLLTGMVSKKTALSQMSFIDDPEKEIERMEEEASMYPDIEVNDEPGQNDEEDQQPNSED